MDDKLRLTLPIALEYPTTPYDTHGMIPNKVTGVQLDYIPLPSLCIAKGSAFYNYWKTSGLRMPDGRNNMRKFERIQKNR